MIQPGTLEGHRIHRRRRRLTALVTGAVVVLGAAVALACGSASPDPTPAQDPGGKAPATTQSKPEFEVIGQAKKGSLGMVTVTIRNNTSQDSRATLFTVVGYDAGGNQVVDFSGTHSGVIKAGKTAKLDLFASQSNSVDLGTIKSWSVQGL